MARKYTTCQYPECSTPLTEEQQKSRNRYCHVECAYAHRTELSRQKELQAEARAAQYARDLEAWLERSRQRKRDRQRRASLVGSK